MTKASHAARAKKGVQVVPSSGVLSATTGHRGHLGHQVPAGLVEELPPAVLFIASIPDTDLLGKFTWLPDTWILGH